MTVSVFAHAAGSKRGGPGGYGVIILAQDGQFEFSGHDESTDKRAMELRGLIEGLNVLKPTTVIVSSSSEYVARASSQTWMEKWLKRGFKTAAGKRISHWRLWLDLASAIARHEQITWMRVRRGGGSQYDDLAQALARQAMAGHVAPLRYLGTGERRSSHVGSRSILP
jgi:ribonuclease HI